MASGNPGGRTIGWRIDRDRRLLHASGRPAPGIGVWFLLHVIYVKHLLVPLFGPFIANDFAKASVLEQWPPLPAMISLLGLGGLTVAALTSRSREVAWLWTAALTMMVLSYFGAIGGQELLKIYPGGRYYYAPQVLLVLTLLGVARTAPAIVRSFAIVLVGWFLFVGVSKYRSINPVMAQGPSWRDQVALWRAGETRVITLWPPPTFQVHLGIMPGAPR